MLNMFRYYYYIITINKIDDLFENEITLQIYSVLNIYKFLKIKYTLGEQIKII